MAHPDEAAKIRTEKLAAEANGMPGEGQTSAEAATVAAVEGAQGTPPVDPAKPAEVPPPAAAAATPAKLDEWASKSPELKAAFEKNPELHTEMMELARGYEAAKPVLDIVSTAEEATFAVEHANRLVSIQAASMLGADDPAEMGRAIDMVVDMFKERDAEGKEVMGADGKAKLGPDFKPFSRGFATREMTELSSGAEASIAAIKARLAGVYPNEEAKAADATALQNAEYEKAAFDFVASKLANPADGPTQLPSLPANATPEQVEFQKKLEAQQKDLDAKAGKQTSEGRKAARVADNAAVQASFEKGVNDAINARIADMQTRGEYLPEFVLNDKWINPQTGQPTKISDFAARAYLEVVNKINTNPVHQAKLRQLEVMGPAGRAQREAEMKRLTTLYLPKILDAQVTRIQDGIRATASRGGAPSTGPGRVEPASQGSVSPTAMSAQDVRKWAEGEAAKTAGFENMDGPTREQMIISIAMRKRLGAA